LAEHDPPAPGLRDVCAAARAAVVLGCGALVAGCEGIQSVLAPASPDAVLTARLTWWMTGVGAFVFIVTMGLLLVALNVFRRGERRPISYRQSTALVVSGGVVAPVLAILALTSSGVVIGDEIEGASAVPGPTVEIVGRRWWWEIRYLDADGEVIAVTANELHLPTGQRSRLLLVSDNVIHSFWAPNLQGKTDLIPGKVNSLYIEPEAPGAWRGQCAEFCGTQHAMMGFVVEARELAEFEDWLARQTAPAAVAGDPGLAVFIDYGCGECHAVRGTPADGQLGPDLTHLASRGTLAAATIPNTRGHLGGWITSTHQVKPGALMPAIVPEPAELQALLDFLGRLE
jgi:cytochrome c oxidase subunit II